MKLRHFSIAFYKCCKTQLARIFRSSLFTDGEFETSKFFLILPTTSTLLYSSYVGLRDRRRYINARHNYNGKDIPATKGIFEQTRHGFAAGEMDCRFKQQVPVDRFEDQIRFRCCKRLWGSCCVKLNNSMEYGDHVNAVVVDWGLVD